MFPQPSSSAITRRSLIPPFMQRLSLARRPRSRPQPDETRASWRTNDEIPNQTQTAARASRARRADRRSIAAAHTVVALASRSRRARVARASRSRLLLPDAPHTATTPRDDAATTRRRREIRHRRPDVARRPGAATGDRRGENPDRCPIPWGFGGSPDRCPIPCRGSRTETESPLRKRVRRHDAVGARANDRAAQGGGFPSRCLAGDSDAETGERIVTLKTAARASASLAERTYRVCSPGINRSVSTRAVERR